MKIIRLIWRFFKRILRRVQNYLAESLPRTYRIALFANAAIYIGITASILANIFYSSEWNAGSVTKGFLVTSIIFPLVGMSAGFFLSHYMFVLERHSADAKNNALSELLQVIEQSARGRSVIGRELFSDLFNQWRETVSKLNDGEAKIYRDYWTVCGNLDDLADRLVECSSVIPLEQWIEAINDHGNSELAHYYQGQKDHLLRRDVKVRRTFVFKSSNDVNSDQFRRICTRQMTDGFELFYIDLSEIIDENHKSIANKDFSLIDRKLLMLGSVLPDNKNVLCFTFYDIKLLRSTRKLKTDVTDMFDCTIDEFLSSADQKLLIEKYRKPIVDFPWPTPEDRLPFVDRTA